MGGGSTAQIETAAGRQPLDYVAIYTQRGEMVGYHNSRGGLETTRLGGAGEGRAAIW